jgi:hypothetical protein
MTTFIDCVKTILSNQPELINEKEDLGKLALAEFNEKNKKNLKCLLPVHQKDLEKLINSQLAPPPAEQASKEVEIPEEEQPYQPPPCQTKKMPKFTIYTVKIHSKEGQILNLFPPLDKFVTNQGISEFPEFGSVTLEEYIKTFKLAKEIPDYFENWESLMADVKLPDRSPNTLLIFANKDMSNYILYHRIEESKSGKKSVHTHAVPRNIELEQAYTLAANNPLPSLPNFINSELWKRFLISPVINSINIISPDNLKIQDRYYKFVKMYYYHNYQPDENDLLSIKPIPQFPTLSYMKLLEAIKDIDIQRADIFMKKIFINRIGISLRLPTEIKKELWCKALANIRSIKLENFTEEEIFVITMWQNILLSPYCYYIFLEGLKGTNHFNTAISQLLKIRFSLKLLCTSLYPICFIFTPFMAKGPRPPVDTNEQVLPKYKKNINQQYKTLALTDSYEENNWIYYATAKEQENHNIGLIFSWLTKLEEKPVRQKHKIVKDDSSENEKEMEKEEK